MHWSLFLDAVPVSWTRLIITPPPPKKWWLLLNWWLEESPQFRFDPTQHKNFNKYLISPGITRWGAILTARSSMLKQGKMFAQITAFLSYHCFSRFSNWRKKDYFKSVVLCNCSFHIRLNSPISFWFWAQDNYQLTDTSHHNLNAFCSHCHSIYTNGHLLRVRKGNSLSDFYQFKNFVSLWKVHAHGHIFSLGT